MRSEELDVSVERAGASAITDGCIAAGTAALGVTAADGDWAEGTEGVAEAMAAGCDGAAVAAAETAEGSG